MKKKFTTVFNWFSKHLKTLLLLLSTLTAAIPYFKTKVTLPIWALILLFLLPFYILHAYHWLFIKKRTFKIGDRVSLKGSTQYYLVNGYKMFSKTEVICKQYIIGADDVIHHQDLLNIYS